MSQQVDVLVIGASQAGLSMGYYLRKVNMSFLIIDAGARIGDNWRRRYDSLTLFTTRAYSSLPGLPFPGDSNGFPSKDETAAYLEHYAKMFSLPVQLETTALSLEQADHVYIAATSKGVFTARQVIVATGPFQKPFVPSFSKDLDKGIYQVHSSSYLNPAQLSGGDVHIVGAGNSGAQIAVELAQAARQVTIAAGHKLKFLPLQFASKSIFWWCDITGLLRANIHSPMGRWFRKQPDPIFGFELKHLIASGRVRIKPKVAAANGSALSFQDGTQINAANVIWATGFRHDYSWIHIPGALDLSGNPVHDRGVTPASGLYFLGLPWQHTRGSALLGGVGRDAEYLSKHIIARRQSL